MSVLDVRYDNLLNMILQFFFPLCKLLIALIRSDFAQASDTINVHDGEK